ncbi:unnamed protein product, partial [Darwinula stevensoni]
KNDDNINPKDKTIIVIGAGISGLAASKKLKEIGFNVIVLEAQDKVGGRLKTNRSLGIAFDEGASWIHGIDGNPITSLAQEAGMTTFETIDDQAESCYDIGDYSNDKIKITHNSIESEADYVLVTVPLGVLKANTIQFIPALPTVKQTAIQKIGMNCVNKFILTWNTPFWDNTQYIVYTPEIKDKFNYFVNVNKFNPTANALMTFAYADYARLTETMTDAQIINEIMVHLKDIYGNNIPNPTNILRTKWQNNENSFGAYSYTAVGEHTNVDYFSTAHGAYLSGLREADKIIALL